jgi:RNA-directed DNA polymerase
MLANVYLNYFDKAFQHDDTSPMHFAKAKLIRYADDFVVQAKYVGKRII